MCVSVSVCQRVNVSPCLSVTVSVSMFSEGPRSIVSLLYNV